MIESIFAVTGMIGIILGYFAYSYFSKAKKQQKIIQDEIADLMHNPRYQVRGKYE